ncbi:Sulfotransferase [hydrothermal vent metagenome]|uniref:Sulfotransferase n=1 Tax=hydrothermal vent metagenome TaxID=652676 RepID=A0A3B0XDV2_9ZZZZ
MEMAVSIKNETPNFFLVGAAKSGTTSLYSYLSQHPDIFLPEVKEPNYYAYKDTQLSVKGPKPEKILIKLLLKKTVTNESDYYHLYAKAQMSQLTGDCSPRYLYSENVAELIYRDCPDAKIIVILRNPVARAYSHYLMNRQRDLEPEDSFENALDQESSRKQQGWGWDWHYLSLGRYGEQLQRYYDRFPKENILVVLHDDFISDQQTIMQEIYRFLGVDDAFCADTRRQFKVASTVGASDGFFGRLVFATETTWIGSFAIKLIPKKVGLLLQNALRDIVSKRRGGRKIPMLSQEIKLFCWQQLQDDVKYLEVLLERDLSHWK